MKPIELVASSQSSGLRNSYRHIFMAVVPLFLLVISVGTAKSQSEDQYHPTPLTSNVISGTLSPDKNGDNYYYSFVAGPGKLTITLTVKGASEARGTVVQAGYALFDEKEIQLASKFTTTYLLNSAQVVENVTVRSREHLLLRIMVQNNSGPGSYRLLVSGPVEFSPKESTGGIQPNDPTTQQGVVLRDCLDTIANGKGTLIIKMKDGSKRIIDLSEADTITIVP